jgi:hypothetical protein
MKVYAPPKKGASSPEPIGSLSRIAKSHLALSETSGALINLSHEEMIARVNLGLGCIAVLRPSQQAYVVMMSTPNVDMMCDIVAVYKLLLRMEGAAFALKHDYELYGGSGGEGGNVKCNGNGSGNGVAAIENAGCVAE